jgi:hypothetical protein
VLPRERAAFLTVMSFCAHLGVMPGGSPSDGERHETEAERIDRNLTELLQELRIAGLGVQVLFGFLLSLPFTGKFSALDRAQRNLYVIDILMSAVATGLLVAPVAHHRILFRHHEKARILRRANTMALLGLGAVGIAISGSVMLVTSVIYDGAQGPVIAFFVAAFLFVLWFVLPWIGHRRETY